MENLSYSFKIKSLAKRTAHELGTLLDLLHKKKRREREDAVMLRVCRPHCYLEALEAGLRLPLPDGVHSGGTRRVFLSLFSRGRWRMGPGCTGQGFIPQSVIFFGLSLVQVGRLHPWSSPENRELAALGSEDGPPLPKACASIS